MPITASYNSVTRKLTVIGDPSVADAIFLSRDAIGNLLVNSGAVPISGGPATVSNTDLIEASGGGGNDTIEIDETNGPLPPATMSGGTGADILRGGSGGDTLNGEAGTDTLEGKGGADFLFGGLDNDTLTGGDGNDQMFGEDGDDRMIWNPGDDSDFIEGGANSDTVEVNGGDDAEVFTATANGTRVDFDRISPAPFSLDIGTTETLVVNMGGGDDSFSATGNLAALISITVDGGAGNDTILGSNGADLLLAGAGNDFVDGQQGSDVAFLGSEDDVFQWDPGDGNDVIEGQDGTDRIVMNGNAANEILTVSANGVRLRLLRDVGLVALDPDDVELLTLNTAGGTDTVAVNDLTGTDATQIVINLAGTIGGSTADGLLDQISLFGDGGGETIDLLGAGGTISVTGLPAFVGINQLDATDRLAVNAGGGNDTINASFLSAGIAVLTLDGGGGDDDIRGSGGSDTLLGGDGNDLVDGNQGLDTAFLGIGNDVFKWDPGDASDVVEGQAGTDELQFNGSNANEVVSILPNGGRSLFVRDVASVNMDMDDVETIRFRTLGGIDNITIADMTGTDVTQVILDLAASSGGGDGQNDSVTVQATAAADTITVAPGSILVSGLFATTRIENSEADDRLIISANGGNDTVDASAIAAGQITLELLGGLGTDQLIGSQGGDLFNGGDGNDSAFMGAGDDVFVWNPGDDNDVLEGQAGTDRLDFNGNASNEAVSISPNGGRVTLFRDLAAVTMDLNGVEQLVFNAGAGTDAVTVNDLSGTDLNTITLNLAGTIGGSTADSQLDQITLFGRATGETIDLLGITGTVSVLGLHAFTVVNQLDATDTLRINGGGGNDTINASFLSAGIAVLTLDGGGGDDTLQGTAGADALLAGDGNDLVDGNQGNDTAFLGAGNDVFNWNPGDASDIVEGQAGSDELRFNGSNANEIVNIVPNGGRASFQRDVAAVTMDLDDVETITFNAVGGTDNITIGDMAGTDVSLIVINLAANSGGSDGLADLVTVNATTLGDNIQIASTSPGVVTLTGLACTVEIRNFDAKDRLIINGLDGNDTIQASPGVGIALTLDGAGGNDILRGGDAFDTLLGGIGDDQFFRSLGGDLVVGGGGNDFVFI